MRNRYLVQCTLIFLFVIITTPEPAQCTLIFSDDFEAQEVGDNSDDLINWFGPASRGLEDPAVHQIVSVDGNKVLRLDDTDPPGSQLFLRSATFFEPFLKGSELSLSLDLKASPDDVFPDRFEVPGATLTTFALQGFGTAGSGNYKVDIILLRDLDPSAMTWNITRTDIDAGTNEIIATVPFTPIDDFQRYELRADFHSSQVDLELIVDGSTVLSVTDTDPVFGPGDPTTAVRPFLSTKENISFVDTVRFTVVPEPSGLALFGLGAIGICGYAARRRRGGRRGTRET